MIKIRDITKKYDNKPVLNNINLNIKKGSCVGILGSNGSGKTTLLSVLAGILKPESGSFIYDIGTGETDLLENGSLRRKLVGFIPQTNPLIEELSARDNLLLWYDKKSMEEELKSGLASLLKIDEFINKPDYKLSGGMKKRLSVACSLYSKPRILLMDEVSAALDIVCKDIIYSYINEYKKSGGTIILVTHDLGELSLCDEHYLLKNGELYSYEYRNDVHELAKMLE